MDVLKFLQGGNKTPNPEYNPKTKKGAIQPPTLVDYNPGTSISDRGRGHLFSRIAEQSYNLNQYDIDKYAPSDIAFNASISSCVVSFIAVPLLVANNFTPSRSTKYNPFCIFLYN